MTQVPIKGVNNLYRDIDNMALINRDKNGLDEYMRKRKLIGMQTEQINNVKEDVSSLKSDVEEIKYLLSQLLEKGNNG